MNTKSSLIVWGLIMVFFLAAALFTGTGTSLAQDNLCRGFARQYADRYANRGGNIPAVAFPGGIVHRPGGDDNWSLLYNHAYESCALDGIVH